MTRSLICHSVGPGVTIQDMGRSGTLAQGLSRGGAADRLALYEGAALLNQSADCAVLEMAGLGGVFETTEDMRIALTGAPMKADIDGMPVIWNAVHALPAHARLTLGAVQSGSYGYLHVGGGLETPQMLAARSAHVAAGLGGLVEQGGRLPVGVDPGTETGLTLPAAPRFSGGDIRVTASLQTDHFDPADLERFEATEFRRDPRANRMGVKVVGDGDGFLAKGGLQVLSEVIVPGDLQVTGDSMPFVLVAESQTTGGYPRIATVIPPDLPKVAQAPAGAFIRFRFVEIEDAVEIHRKFLAEARALRKQVTPVLRDPSDLANLAEFQLISGVTSGYEEGES